ncbi:unnamed protein product, partial [marine sediment metagenome]
VRFHYHVILATTRAAEIWNAEGKQEAITAG